ncbi:ABC transporter permease [Intrasporangium sp.]|uniref:ABC transporter permease n=1 Tax=Intrasporangium sp. TaxID=1925024 RepID=UPI00293B7518|nr:ABC transporter permease [Intrasporangium sp.]MDV3219890.1 ABC transporter permease [Intrasporangium sp.]
MRVTRILVRRAVSAAPLLLVLLFLTVALQAITPGDPARAIAGPRASEAVLAATRAAYHLDDGIVQQFTSAVARALQGDLGTSNRSGVPVTTLISERAPRTAWLAALGLLVSALISLPFGIWAGTSSRFERTVVDQASLVSMNLPTYWLALVLVLVFSLGLAWFPVGGFGEGLGDRLQHLVLPTVAISAAIAPVLVRSLSESMARVMAADHVTTARAAGLGAGTVVRRHAIRNALPPMVTLLGLQAGYIVFGLVLVESSFDINGLGTLLFESVRERDFPVVQGLTLVLGICVVLANLLADVAVALLDPRWSL